jgi:homoserine O-acetyltransferase/O-succinyltransferase
MMSIELAVLYPDRVRLVVPIASGLEVTVLQRILNLEQIGAIESDPNYRGGDYYSHEAPLQGLALARMISHKTFISLSVMESRAREEVVGSERFFSNYRISHPVESYMLHQGQKFTQRFDANTYLAIMEAWQRYDLLKYSEKGRIEDLFTGCIDQQFLVFSIDSDVCFYPEEQACLVQVLKSSNIKVQHITVHSDKGHDAFFLESELFSPYLSYVLGR